MNRYIIILCLFLISIIKSSAQDDTFYFLKANYLQSEENYTKALIYLDSVKNETFNIDLLKGKIYQKQKKLNKAILFYQSCNRKKNQFANFELSFGKGRKNYPY